MKLATSLNGHSFRFTSITDVLAKASEPKAGDRLTGIAAETASERLAAKVVLSELTVGELTENPTVPYEDDEVTRVNWDGLNQPGYESMKTMTIGELREWVLDHKTTPDVLKRSGRNFVGEVASAVAKIMTSMDLVYGASKIRYVTHCNTEIGQAGTISYRAQTNSTTDDPETIVLGLAEAVSFGCGDACLGINPVGDDPANTLGVLIDVAVLSAVGLGVYLAAAWAMRIHEVGDVVQLVQRKVLRRRGRSSGEDTTDARTLEG